MQTQLLNAPVAAPVASYPSIYRHKTTKIVWWNLGPDLSVCLYSTGNGCYKPGNTLNDPGNETWEPAHWERLTSPVDIRFIP